MDPHARALRFMWRIADASADEVVTVPCGTVLRSPSIIDAYSVNALRVERGGADLTLDDVAVRHAAHAAGPDLYVLVEEEPVALRLAADARAAGGGWSASHEVVMLLARAPDPAPRADAVRDDATLDEILALFRTWLAEEGHSERTIDHLARRRRREHAAGPERLLVADHDGLPAAMATVRLGDGVAQVEDVYALPAARGTGLGRAVVAHAARLAAAHADVAVIVADAEDWPKELYAALGFAQSGRRAALHRAPQRATGT